MKDGVTPVTHNVILIKDDDTHLPHSSEHQTRHPGITLLHQHSTWWKSNHNMAKKLSGIYIIKVASELIKQFKTQSDIFTNPKKLIIIIIMHTLSSNST